MSIQNLLNGFLTIKDFSELVGITVKSLRNYDKKGIFHPAKHGVEHENNYRYYSAPQIITAKLIRVLTEIGVPLETIKSLAQTRTPEKVLKILCQNRKKMDDEIRFYQDASSVVDAFIGLIQEGMSITENEITLNEMPERRIILGDKNHFAYPGVFIDEFIRFYKSAHEPYLNMSFPVGAYWPDIKSFLDAPVSPARFYSLDPKGNERIKSGLYLNAYTRGYYGCINDLPERMETYAKKNGLRFSGEIYGIYLFDEISIIDQEQYLMKVSAAVTETQRILSHRPRRYHRL